jgi:tetratricopeptide (TPR) repeat protein
MLSYVSSKSILTFALAGLSYFLALISKETGIAFLVIIPLIMFFFTDTSWKKIVSSSAVLLIITGIWLVIRMNIFTDLTQSTGVSNSVLNNTLNAAPDFISRQATVFYVLLRYVILLVFPHPLSCDYNFSQIKIQTLTSSAALIAIIFFLALAIYSIVNFTKRNIVVFCILFFLITVSPVSNFFFVSGSIMAERFMYMPSLGFCIILSYFLIKFTKTEYIKNTFNHLSKFLYVNTRVFIFVFGIIILYSVKTFSRNFDWKDNVTIFGHDVHISKNSATAHFIYGTSLLYDLYPKEEDAIEKDRILDVCIEEINRGMEIISEVSMHAPIYNFHLGTAYLYKKDYKNAMINLELYKDKYINPNVEVYRNLAVAYFNLNMYDKTIQSEDSVIKYSPAFWEAFFNKGLALAAKQEYGNAIKQFQKAIELNPGSAELYYNRGIVFSNEANYEEALNDYNKAIELNPDYVEALINRGSILNSEKNYDEAIKDLSKAIKLRANFPIGYFNRGISFINQKKYDEAIKDFDRAIELKPDYVLAYYNRGMAKFNSGNKETACLDFQKAATLGYQPAKEFVSNHCQ